MEHFTLTHTHNTFFSSVHGTLPKIDPILKHKESLDGYEKIWNNILHPIWVLCFKTEDQQQQQQEAYKLKGTEQFTTEWKNGSRLKLRRK